MAIDSKEYVSLQQAAAQCEYSQEYLSLRARQGKLQAVKIGRNWATTKEWLAHYIETAENHKKPIPWPDPPSNLPVHAPEADFWEEASPREIAQRLAFWRKAQFAFAAAMAAVILVFGGLQGRESLFRAAEHVTPAMYSAVYAVQIYTEETGFRLGANVARWGEGWIGERIRSIAAWFGIFESEEAEFAATPPSVPKNGKNGMVVIPSTKDDERAAEQVKQSFSDQVLVTPHDEESGIITPVFRSRTGQDYLYILVPLRENDQ